MERIMEKLGKFSEMVMQDAYRKKNERIKQAEMEKKESISSAEIKYLHQAYEKIQEAVRAFDKEFNEEISQAIVESKEAMFNRRDEIIASVFSNVRERLQSFARGEEYPAYIEGMLKHALKEARSGEISVIAAEDDLNLFREIRTKLGIDFSIKECDEAIIGGFLIMNKDKGYIWDYSFLARLNDERSSFLERYAISVE